MGQEKEIEIQDDAPGAAPGISFPDIIKYGALLQKLIEILAQGEGGFDVKFKGIRKHVEITNL